MGACSSSKNENKKNFNNPNVSSSYHTPNVAMNQPQQAHGQAQAHSANQNNAGNLKNQAQSFGGSIYPRGASVLLRKIQGKVVAIDKLKRRVELYLNLIAVPQPGSYSANFEVVDKNKTTKIASLAPENTDNNGQLYFSNYVEMDYFFERDQSLQVTLTHNNSGNKTLFTEKIGRMASSMKHSHIVNNSNFTVEFKMIPIKSERKLVTFINSVVNEQNKQPEVSKEIFAIYKNINDGLSWRGVYKSEEAKNWVFQPVNIPEDDLYLGDDTKKFKVEIYEVGNSNPIGICTPCIKDVHAQEGLIPLVDIKGNQTEYKLRIQLQIIEQIDFMELLKKGLQISLMVGIDFTGSNGHPKDKGSLHYCKDGFINDYEKAIRQCGEIVAYYDYDQLFPLFGFCGVPQGSYSMHDVFPLNYQNDPSVKGIDEMIQVYKRALEITELSGPTNFAPLLNNLAELAEKSPQGVYFTIMIITDGAISDMDDTKDAIVRCSRLPISIIIIGVGNGDFGSMEELDGDDMPLKSSQGVAVSRDIVQFVPFNRFSRDITLLSEEVLKELPGQIEVYYRNQKFN